MRNLKLVGLMAAVAALAVAGPVAAAPDKGKSKSEEAKTKGQKKGVVKNLTRKACKQERSEIGKAAFKEAYGDGDKNQHAMRNCKRVSRSSVAKAKTAAVNDCKAERETLGAEAFRAQYGTNKNGKNAFGKCVSGSVKNAAKECKAELADVGEDAFRETYGTNKNGKNAFGKCVSAKAKAQGDDTGDDDDTDDDYDEAPAV